MFEFLFKYPAAVFSRGTLVPARNVAGVVAWRGDRHRGRGLVVLGASQCRGIGCIGSLRSAAVWLLQTLLASLLLLMLWHPALSVATLRPQQNIVAVVVDDSSSMAQADEAAERPSRAAAVQALNSGLLNSLRDKFQVRLYRLTDHLERFDKLEQLNRPLRRRTSAKV